MAKKEWKVISHYEQMHNVELRPKLVSLASAEDEVQEVIDGNIITRKVPASEKFKGLDSRDFALENVLAAGATQMLKPLNYDGDTIASIDTMNAQVDAIEQSINEIKD